MDTGVFDSLVKLASLGTAGVSILAIFIIGASLFRLSNKTSAEKVALIKKYMNMCIIIAVICAFSGVANAYFNGTKVAEANAKRDQIATAYENEAKKVDSERVAMMSTINSLKTQINASHALTPSLANTIKNAEVSLNKMRVTPVDSVLKSGKTRQLK